MDRADGSRLKDPETPDFWIEPSTGERLSYPDLARALSRPRGIDRILCPPRVSQLWTELVHAMLAGASVELLDRDLSPGERATLTGEAGLPADRLDLPGIVVAPEALPGRVLGAPAGWRLTLHTSGTTGRPRKVSHRMETLTRAVRRGGDHVSARWGLAYHPSHFAGLQVFFQALLNLNPLVNVFHLGPGEFAAAVTEHGVTHLSATPTFYRAVALPAGGPFPAVRRVTLGGERFDPDLAASLARVFPSARVLNVYASTEAGTLFAADGEHFRVPAALRDRVRIAADGELCVHGSLLAEIPLGGGAGETGGADWYRTGDVVEPSGADRFRFLARAGEMINVGGLKVNPHEVEAAIRAVEGVLDAVVGGRKNPVTGEVVSARVQAVEGADPEDLEARIRSHLSTRLQPHKVPRIYSFTRLELTRTGKKMRPA